MKQFLIAAALVFAQAAAQSGNGSAVLVNGAEARWTRDAGDPPGSESIVLREDAKTGAVELFARYPAGHVFAPHWHSANERIIVVEGRISVRAGEKEAALDSGGYAYLPAKEVQHMSCVSKTRCAFYVYWDAKLDSHRAP
jgi:quercetin dioxygenase-like cupin family protein